MRNIPQDLAALKVRQAQLRTEMSMLETVISEKLQQTPAVVIPELLQNAPSSPGEALTAGLSALTGNGFYRDSNGNGDTSGFLKFVTSPLGRMLIPALVATIRDMISDREEHFATGNGQTDQKR